MSNSIWKTPDQKPDSRKQILIYDGFDYSIEISHPEYWEDKGFVDKWCYLTDLIAQADKAERLQKALQILKDFITKLYLNGNITDEQLERYKNEVKKIITLEQESNN